MSEYERTTKEELIAMLMQSKKKTQDMWQKLGAERGVHAQSLVLHRDRARKMQETIDNMGEIIDHLKEENKALVVKSKQKPKPKPKATTKKRVEKTTSPHQEFPVYLL